MSEVIQAKVSSVGDYGSVIVVFCISKHGRFFSITFDRRQFFYMMKDKWAEDEDFVLAGQTIEYDECDEPIISFVDDDS